MAKKSELYKRPKRRGRHADGGRQVYAKPGCHGSSSASGAAGSRPCEGKLRGTKQESVPMMVERAARWPICAMMVGRAARVCNRQLGSIKPRPHFSSGAVGLLHDLLGLLHDLPGPSIHIGSFSF